MKAPGIILYAEDEENDVFFLNHALEIAGSSYTLRAVPDGEQAPEYLAGQGRFADRKSHPLPAFSFTWKHPSWNFPAQEAPLRVSWRVPRLRELVAQAQGLSGSRIFAGASAVGLLR
jgi:hypothetical protein